MYVMPWEGRKRWRSGLGFEPSLNKSPAQSASSTGRGVHAPQASNPALNWGHPSRFSQRQHALWLQWDLSLPLPVWSKGRPWPHLGAGSSLANQTI